MKTMSTGRQGRRLKAIGWLMLAGALLLLLFLGEWLRTQYNSQESKLDQEVKLTLALAEVKMQDSLFKNVISLIVSGTENEKGITQAQVSMPPLSARHPAADSTHFRTVSVYREERTKKGPVNIHLKSSRTTTVLRPDLVSGKNISLPDVQAGKPIEEAMGAMIRMAIMQKYNAADIPTKADSTYWLKTFQKALNGKRQGLLVQWDTAVAASALPFHYGKADSLEVSFAVTGYKPILIKGIVPQAAFSLLLLLLICAAFALAYRTMRQQAQFNQQKDSFISNISHELKTPVATTKVALEALTTYQGLEDPERARKYLNVAHWEMNRLGILIDRIMNVIQAQNGKIQLIQEPLQPALLVTELVQTLQPVFEEKKVTITWEPGNNNATVRADKIHLQGAIYNLIDNALKYGGDQIQIHQTIRSNQLQLTVADNGPGIPAVYRHKVFESFFRIPTGNQHNVKGHGLGLSYAHDIIAAHGGSLSLESTGEGGAVFLITLPVQPVS